LMGSHQNAGTDSRTDDVRSDMTNTGNRLIALVLAAGMTAGACGAIHHQAHSELKTTEATTPAPPPRTCRSGIVSTTASSSALSERVCLVSGATLNLTLDKSPGQWGGTSGDWTEPPVTVVGPERVLALRSVSVKGQLATARLAAHTPGTSIVTGHFEVWCAPIHTSPCTIPPIGEINVTVEVVPS
jgi:hypothetical protein